ncbi:Putative signal peptide peptidase SppA [Sporomusa acidovorans DSM 3132]|uniref:Signal peptide peptidase SppA n=3 Tax=Sporomusa TaxID=2375 RepID=A0ABZ3IW86_SPOA4|nr:putative signal peptide peptidase SppA [Sporomusa acidovorans DSM 3132]SDE23149.1 protease-4 [Sporomusa acidovorans]
MFKRSVVIFLAIIIGISMLGALFITPKVNKSKHNDKIAVIYVDGMIVGGRGQVNLFTEGGGTDALIRQLHAARDDASVKAIVLRINSPGGTVPASQEVGEELKKVRAAGKPVITSMADMAASGGYWLAACTDKIYANPSTITGSLGVYMPYSNWEELYKKIGVRQEKIKSGPHKDILSPDRPLTEEERAIIQVMVDDMYNQFVEVIAEGRHLDPATVRELADGRIYTGRQAKEFGLVDELGNMYDAIDGAAALVGIQGKPEIIEYGKLNALEALFGAQDSYYNKEQQLLKQLKEMLSSAGPAAAPQSY